MKVGKPSIIPEIATLRGSIRTYSQPVRDQLIERLGAFASRIAQAYRAEAHVEMNDEGCPAVVNPAPWAGHVHDLAEDEFGPTCVHQAIQGMGSDDMSLFLNARTGCYFRVGIAPPGKDQVPHHSPIFEMDERGLEVGVRIGLRTLLFALQNEVKL